MFWYLILDAGVLLLNACLTVRQREANSHAGKVRLAHFHLLLNLVHSLLILATGMGGTDRRCHPLDKQQPSWSCFPAVGLLCSEERWLYQQGRWAGCYPSLTLLDTLLSSFSSARQDTTCWRLSTLRLFRLAEGFLAASISRRQTGYLLPRETNPLTGLGFLPRLTTSLVHNVCHAISFSGLFVHDIRIHFLACNLPLVPGSPDSYKLLSLFARLHTTFEIWWDTYSPYVHYPF